MKVRASDVVSGLRFKFRIQARCSSCCLRLLRPRQVAPPCQVYVYRVRGAAPQRHRHVCLTGRCTGGKLGVDVEDQLAGVGIVFQDKGREGMRIEHCLPNGLYTHTHTHTHTHTQSPASRLQEASARGFLFLKQTFPLCCYRPPTSKRFFVIIFETAALLLEALSLVVNDRQR
jgi:hypothetical protein